MLPSDISRITIAHFENLVSSGIGESDSLEFKSELRIGSDNDKKEFLADVSSLANAKGGDIIYGISEKVRGTLYSLSGITLNTDDTVLRIESIIRDGITPRIIGIQYQSYLIDKELYALLVRVPKSNELHMITFKDSNKYFTRGAKGKYLMDPHEIRQSIIRLDKDNDLIKEFIEKRIIALTGGDFPEALSPFGKIAVHIVPHNTSHSYDIFKSEYHIDDVPPLGGGSRTPRRNIDGYICASRSTDPYAYAYVQIYRNGIIESVESDYLRPYQGEKMFGAYSSFNFEKMIVTGINEFIKFYKRASITAPFSIFIHYIGIKGYGISSDLVRDPIGGRQYFTTDSVSSGEIILSNLDDDIPALLKKHFDTLWNAWGYKRSYNYSEAGDWIADSK